ncbi:MAG: peptidase family [Dehalococcoidia bacterium]|nr:peptidase family [Dehalococcoidia bacterium]
MPHTRSVSISIYMGVGSCYESPEVAGVSHFVEHLCFKGTQRRPTALEISETIDRVGGYLNGATEREFTVYWSKVARPHFALAMDLLLDMIHNSRFDPEEIDKERKVIIEELNMLQDSPGDLVSLIIDQVMWPDHPLGRDVAGSRETVGSLNREQLFGHLERHYVPAKTVVSVSGAVSHEEVLEAIASVEKSWRPNNPLQGKGLPSYALAPAVANGVKVSVERRSTEQAHFCLGMKGLPLLHPDRYALDMLNVILGEGMSSRLFMEVRERRGLAYDVHSYVSHFQGDGALTVYAGVAPKVINEAISAVLEQVALLRDGVSEEELSKVREMTKGTLLLRMEDSRSVSAWAGAQQLLTNRIRTVDEVVSLLDLITVEDVNRVAREQLLAEKWRLAVVGPYRSLKRFETLLRT